MVAVAELGPGYLVIWAGSGAVKLTRLLSDRQNPYAAQITGVDDQKISRLTFGLGTAFAGFAGALMAMLSSFNPDFGRPLLVRAFVIIVLGGLESVSGVAFGALILALVETFSILVIPSGLQPAVSFGLLVVVLLVFPTGIAGLMKHAKKLDE